MDESFKEFIKHIKSLNGSKTIYMFSMSDKEGFSIPSQLKLLNSYATQEGFIVKEEFVDVETAKRSGRTEFGNMVAALKKNPLIKLYLLKRQTAFIAI